mmetsp:Transcript_3999/g.9397  ORF Transcript_3999/g.9397 Transcript_3999/m.9397 type:complete len:258 (-) Transcript_3999:390-1163(-)
MNPPYCGAEACMYSEEGAGGAAGCSTGSGAGTGSATTGAGTGASGSGSGTGTGARAGSPIGTGADPPKRSDSNALPAAFRSSCCWSIRSFVACRSWMLLRASFRAPRVWRSSSIRSVMVPFFSFWALSSAVASISAALASATCSRSPVNSWLSRPISETVWPISLRTSASSSETSPSLALREMFSACSFCSVAWSLDSSSVVAAGGAAGAAAMPMPMAAGAAGAGAGTSKGTGTGAGTATGSGCCCWTSGITTAGGA